VKIHVVKEGETLWAIARKHGVSLEELLKANPDIQNPDVIQPGMKIKIPAAAHPPYELMHKHTVQQGDTLWKLAKAWGIPLADMIKANPHLKNPNVLMTGEIVNIPKVKPAGPSPHAGETGGMPGVSQSGPGQWFSTAHGKPDTSVKPTAQLPHLPPAETEAPEIPQAVPQLPAPETPKPAGEEEPYADLFKKIPIPPLEAAAPPMQDHKPPYVPVYPPCPPLGAMPFAPGVHGMPHPMPMPLPVTGKHDCGCGGTGGKSGAQAPAAGTDPHPGLGAGWPGALPEAQAFPAHPWHVSPLTAQDPQLSHLPPMVQPYPQPLFTPIYAQTHVQPYALQDLHLYAPQPFLPGHAFQPFPRLPQSPVPFSPSGTIADPGTWWPGLELQPADVALGSFGTAVSDAGTASGPSAAVAGAEEGAGRSAADASGSGDGEAAKDERGPKRTGKAEKDDGKPVKGKLKSHAFPPKEPSRRKRSTPWTNR
jgi:spore coat assembly protein SafA